MSSNTHGYTHAQVACWAGAGQGRGVGDSPHACNSKVRIIWNGLTYRECTQWIARPAVSRSRSRYTRWIHGGTVLAVEPIIWSESLETWTVDRFFHCARPSKKKKMASGSSVDKSSIDRRLFQQVYISPLEAVRDFFEALSELRAASAPSNDTNNARYTH